MKRSNEYMLCELAGLPYLLPFGQGIADHRRGIRINPTGAYLWELLKCHRSEETLLSLCAAHFHAQEDELPGLSRDIRQFLAILDSYGMIQRELSDIGPKDSHPWGYVEIGGLVLELKGPHTAFSQQFSSFAVKEPSCVHQTVTVLDRRPPQRANGQVLLRNEELILMENQEEYILLFPSFHQLWEGRLTKDGSLFTFFCRPPHTEEFRENLFHAVRLGFLYLAQRHHMAVIHSASLLYRGRAWLFSGPSGAGKSTHTELWHKLFDTPLLNGDLNLLAPRKGTATVLGLPWCGTSGISQNCSFPLGGIILLKQADTNRVETLSPDQKQLLVLQRLISPSWTPGQQQENLTLSGSIASSGLVCRLYCTREAQAADTMRHAIDCYLESGQIPRSSNSES